MLCGWIRFLPNYYLVLNVADKYTTNGLALFLKDPHAVRPSDRMPSDAPE